MEVRRLLRGAPPDALRWPPHSPASSYFPCLQSRSLPWLLHPSAPPLSRRLPVSSQVRAAVPEHTSLQSWGPRPACQSPDSCPPCQPLCPVAESAPSPPHCPQEGPPSCSPALGGQVLETGPRFSGAPTAPRRLPAFPALCAGPQVRNQDQVSTWLVTTGDLRHNLCPLWTPRFYSLRNGALTTSKIQFL